MYMRVILVLFSISLFFSCSVVGVSDELIDLGSPYEALQYIQTHAKYQKDAFDEWQLPSTTINIMTGDCDDWAGLFASSIISRGETATLVVGYYNSKNGNSGGHMTVRYKNTLYSPQWKNPIMDETRYTIWYELSFEEYLRRCVK